MKQEIVKIVVERLRRERAKIQAEYFAPRNIQTKFAAIDNLLPSEIAEKIYMAFPPLEEMRLMKSFRELKYTSKSLEKMNPLLADVTFALQAQEVIEEITQICNLQDLSGDPKLYAGGISAMTKGHFLNPHIDNSHDSAQELYRMLNLLYYVSPDWSSENGGNLELWDEKVKEKVEIPSLFNRLVIMETNSKSYHSVNEVKVERPRYCVSNYYFSPHPPEGREISHVTFFMARPEQTLRRLVTYADSSLRTALRGVKKQGFAEKDVFDAEASSEKKTE